MPTPALPKVPRAAERKAAYRALFETEMASPVLQEIRATIHQGQVLGTERFKDAIETTLARRMRPGKPGRPQKDRAAHKWARRGRKEMSQG